MYNLTEQQVRKLIEDAWSASRAMQNFVRHGTNRPMPNDLEKHTNSVLATLHQSAQASSVGEKYWKERFAEWYYANEEESADIPKAEDCADWFEQNVLRAEEAPTKSAGEKNWEGKFEYWLTNNLQFRSKSNISHIIDYVKRYILKRAEEAPKEDEKGNWKDLVIALDKYITILAEEIRDNSGYLDTHGIHSKNVELGQQARTRIEEARIKVGIPLSF